jgi:hypothetical protein
MCGGENLSPRIGKFLKNRVYVYLAYLLLYLNLRDLGSNIAVLIEYSLSRHYFKLLCSISLRLLVSVTFY